MLGKFNIPLDELRLRLGEFPRVRGQAILDNQRYIRDDGEAVIDHYANRYK